MVKKNESILKKSKSWPILYTSLLRTCSPFPPATLPSNKAIWFKPTSLPFPTYIHQHSLQDSKKKSNQMHATATKPTWIYSWWVILPCLKVELKPAKNGGNHRYRARISYTSGKKKHHNSWRHRSRTVSLKKKTAFRRDYWLNITESHPLSK